MQFINVKITEQGPLATFKTTSDEVVLLDQFEVAKRHNADLDNEQIKLALHKLRAAKSIEATA